MEMDPNENYYSRTSFFSLSTFMISPRENVLHLVRILSTRIVPKGFLFRIPITLLH